jgi:peptide/nickel transport system substrate-binding protein
MRRVQGQAMLLTRRRAVALGGAFTLPRSALAEADARPSITIAVQKISTSNTLEPMREQSNVGQRVFYTFAETLTDHAWTGDLSLRPALAESWRRIDERTLELKLREGVRFHNGDEMTAEDVAFSFGPERMWTGSSVDTRGMWVSTTPGAATKVPPPEAPRIAQSAYPGFERMEITGKYTVRFVNRVPDATLEGRLARNTGAIFSRRAFGEARSWLDWARQPVGTGPYRIVAYKPDAELLLEAFDDYWEGRPPIKRIRFVEVPEVASRANGLRAGDFDFACDMPPDQIAGIEANPRLEVVGGPIMNIRLTIFDKHHPTLKDARVRRAMTHAIDRQAIVDALWTGRTRVPKGLQWDFFGPMLLSDWSAPAYDPAEARRLLKEAGYDGAPVPYQMLSNYYTNQVQTAEIMVEQWKAVGLGVAIEMKENWGQILGRFAGRGICENSNSSWFNDPVASLAAYAPGGQTWEARQWENGEIVPLMAALQTGMDIEQRRRDFRRILTLLEREDPAYNVLHQTATFTAKRRDYKWRPAQSFVVDFRASNWG